MGASFGPAARIPFGPRKRLNAVDTGPESARFLAPALPGGNVLAVCHRPFYKVANGRGEFHVKAPGGWLTQWATATAVASLAATGIDAALLQRGQSYFTGGSSFSHVGGFPAVVIFLICSTLADFAVLGLPVAVVLWVAGRLGVSRRASWIAGVTAGSAPVVVIQIVNDRLARYFGEAADLRLLFDLAGRSPAEIAAVASGHFAELAVLVGVSLAATIGLLWVAFRRPRGAAPAVRVPLLRVLVTATAMLFAGTAGRAVARRGSDALESGLKRKPSAQVLSLVANRVSDWDRDGYGMFGRPHDSAPFDARIHPYAIDVPGNGVDENGLAGDLPAGDVPAADSREPARGWTQRPNVVLVVLETFRADIVGATVLGRPVTPVLDALAAQGVSARLAYSHNGHTVRSRYHIFSGRMTLDRGGSTLIDDFKANGYEVACFSAQDESFGGPDLGVGFERADVAYDARQDRGRRYTFFETPGTLGVPHNVLHERVAGFLAARQPDRPLFLYVNFQDTHFPYHHAGIEPLLPQTKDSVVPQAEFGPDRAAPMRAMYLNTAANVDRAVGRLLDAVRRTLGTNPAVIVLSDHGESLFDDGLLGHGYELNDAQTRIPFIAVNLPFSIEEPFGQADLRAALSDAVRARPTDPRTPGVRSNPSRRVFQYLGTIEHPAQIGFVDAAGRATYDFRSNLFRLHDGPWQKLGALSAGGADEFRNLVHAWERMVGG